jgi:hypothetical protein
LGSWVSEDPQTAVAVGIVRLGDRERVELVEGLSVEQVDVTPPRRVGRSV